MKTSRRVFRSGNSLAITLPSSIAHDMGWRDGSMLNVSALHPGAVLIADPPHPALNRGCVYRNVATAAREPRPDLVLVLSGTALNLRSGSAFVVPLTEKDPQHIASATVPEKFLAVGRYTALLEHVTLVGLADWQEVAADSPEESSRLADSAEAIIQKVILDRSPATIIDPGCRA